MRTIYLLRIVLLVLLTAACSRGPQTAEPQSGPLVGRWEYEGNDLSERGDVRSFVIGDHTWFIKPMTEFRPDGTVNSGYGQSCLYWIVSDLMVKLDCSQGQTTIKYLVNNDRLELSLQGPNTALFGGSPEVSFRRVP